MVYFVENYQEIYLVVCIFMPRLIITCCLISQDGIYVRGLLLEGAAWDKGNACLTEPQPMQLVCVMPVIHFKPVKQGKKEKTKGTLKT